MSNNVKSPYVTQDLDVFGGLYSEANPPDLPAGASPLVINCDFTIGSVGIRPGLASTYYYTDFFSEKIAGFAETVAGVHAPNEEPWLNPMNATLDLPGTYAEVTLNAPSGNPVVQSVFGDPRFGLTLPASVSSTNRLVLGIFVNPNDVVLDSVTDNQGNIYNLLHTELGPIFASYTLFLYEVITPSAGSTTVTVGITGFAQVIAGFYELTGLPNPAFDQFVMVNSSGSGAMASGTASPTVQANELLLGFAISNGSEGPPTITPGTGFTEDGTSLASTSMLGESQVVQAIGSYEGTANTTGNAIWAMALATFRASAPSAGNVFSQELRALNFPFSIPSTVGIFGFEVEITGNQTSQAADAFLTVSLLHPSATSPSFNIQLPSSDGTIIVGAPTQNWGLTLLSTIFNNPNFGIKVVAQSTLTSDVTFRISAIKVKVFLTPDPPPSINYLKTFEETSGDILNLFLGSDGVMYQEDVNTAEGALTGVYTAIEPNSFAQSCTQSDREFIAISNLQNGTDIPYSYNGINFDRLSQVGPGAPPSCSTTSSGNTILTIMQPTAKSDPASPGHVSQILWSAGPGNTQPGNVLTVYYAMTATHEGHPGQPNPDPDLVIGGNVQLAGFASINGQTVDGDYVVTSTGQQVPPHSDNARWFFTVTMLSPQFFQNHNGEPSAITGTYQVTLATMTTASQVPNLEVGNQFSISGTGGSPPTGYDGTWTVLATPNASQMLITSVSRSANVATYSFSLITGTNPIVGQFVTVAQTLAANGAFNVANVAISSTSPGSFSISLPGPDQSSSAESGSGIIFGTIFQFDPLQVVGNKSGGTIQTAGVIAAGTRKCCYSFLTRNGYITQPSPITTFTVPSGASSLVVSNLLLGPNDVIARIIHLTAAEGGNFYNIPQNVSVLDNGVTVINTATWVLDNTSVSATLSFSDAVLLAASQIDIQGNNLFETAELGSSLGFIPYAGRIFAIGEQNKITNFINWSFDGGIAGGTGSTATFPAGWTVDPTNGGGGSVIDSPIFGSAYSITNSTGSTQAVLGMISQTAFQDEFEVPIIQASTLYSVRVTAAVPTGPTTGQIVVDLFSAALGQALGTYTLQLSTLATTMLISSGTMLTTVLAPVPNDLSLRLYATNILDTVQITIDRIEVFPTDQPNLSTIVTGSYINNFEAFDQVTGVISGAVQNQQPIRSAFELFDVLYLVKTKSYVAIRNVDGLEPVFWGTPRTGSQAVGTPSIYGVTSGIDTPNAGEEWAIIAGEAGAFIFNGGEPIKLSEEIQQLWNQINWRYGHTLWVQNDITNRRILIGIPLKTPNTWLPTGFIPDDSNPVTPNVVLELSYKQLTTAGELAHSVGVRPTYSGKLLSTDYTRKWSVWPISVPAAAFITRSDTTSPIFFGNSKGNGKIYHLVTGQLDDDGVAIHQKYRTYGFPSTEQEQSLGVGGVRKIFPFMTAILDGSGSVAITALPNTTDTIYPTPLLPDITLPGSNNGDTEVPMNVTADRCFFDFDSNAIGSGFELSRMMVAMRQDPFAPVRGRNN